MTSRFAPSTARRLIRAGFGDVARTERLLADPALRSVLPDLAEPDDDVLAAFAVAADPDLALLTLARLAGAVEPASSELLARVWGDVEARARLLAVTGASAALGNALVARPADLEILADDAPGTGVVAVAVREELLVAVGADPRAGEPVATAEDATSRMRRAYRARLLRIAASDLAAGDPGQVMPAVGAALADLAGAALEAALAIARAEVGGAGAARLAVIGMGKTGGRELNYVSDVDVVYVVEPGRGVSEDEAIAVGTRLATALAAACSATGTEPALWPVDAALRPEGKNGPLVRTLDSHRSYYERWAKGWEFQALLKARPVAGDVEVGTAFTELVAPLVWSAAGRENFVEDTQAMRRRVVDTIPAGEADAQIKLGPGGLRDVEFTVQLLQLVHGRADESIRSANSLEALAALSAGGYVGREHAARFAECYRFLRVLEHRVQLHQLRRTHLMPSAEPELRRLARAAGMRAEGAAGLVERWRQVRREVRALHEAIFYRPLLPATAQLAPEEVALAPEAARARFAAIGYRDPDGAIRHVAALTEGVTRRAAIQRQLLPVMLGWFAEGTDPDAGLLSFRKLSEQLGTTHWYLKLLRDSGVAAQRLARVLSTSRYVAEALVGSPEAVAWFDDDAELTPPPAERLHSEGRALLARAPSAQAAATALRALRRRELARTSAAQVLEVLDARGAAEAVTDAADVVLAGVLEAAVDEVRRERGLDVAPSTMLVVAMGRLGGREMGFVSDADVMFAHEPAPGVGEEEAQDFATAVAALVRSLAGGLGPEPPLEVDADLRPEGRNGPLVRSLASYTEYYARWASTWERQALLRARHVAGSHELWARFAELVDPVRYPAGGLDEGEVREIRRIKARVESERLPRGVPRARHLKLGPGGLADVEWTAQLLQLRFAGTAPELRTTSTLGALDAAAEASLLDPGDARTLSEAWLLAAQLRDALVLWSGRASTAHADQLPHDRRALLGVARLLGRESGGELEEEYLRAARRARAVVERVFYD